MKISEVKKMILDKSLLNKYNNIHKISKGWSADKKYFIESKTGEKYLLRVNPIEYLARKEKEFNIIEDVYKLEINMSKPIDFGICNNGQSVYILLSWIEGKDLDEEITSFSDEEQYNIGIKAGKILKKLHSISAPAEQEDWEQRMLKKFNYHLNEYKKCGIEIKNDNKAIKYVQENLHLLKNRPQTFHHGDFHVGNLILTSKNSLGVIDFNRWDYGDPYEDFYKMMFFSRDASISFARGQIDGYFNGKIPKIFFEILALYVADVILYSVVWAISYGEEEVNTMLRLAEMIFTDYDNFNLIVPKWFKYT